MGDGGEMYIVVYGADVALLKTRQLVLETGGFKVATATSVEEAERLLCERPAAVLLLCHSLTSEACEHAMSMATALSPLTRRLILQGSAALTMKGLCDAAFDATDGPLALIQFVRRIIDTPTQKR